MKNKISVLILFLFCLVNLFAFQNCSSSSDEQTLDNSSLGTDEYPQVVVASGSIRCTGVSDSVISFGQPISICIQNAGNNPQYCVKNSGIQNLICNPLSGAPGWTFRSQDGVWYKTFPYVNNPSLYFFPESYYIEVRATSNINLRGTTQFVVQ